MSKKVISRSQIPVGLPINTTISAYLLLDKFSASDLVCGIVWTLITIIWIGAILSIMTDTSITLDLKEDVNHT